MGAIEDPGALAVMALIGVVAGTINTIAGGGSLITLPALIFLGLPAGEANATNRVGVLLQSIAAVGSFARAGQVHVAPLAPRIASAGLGALVGAVIATRIDASTFRHVIGALMIPLLLIILVRPARWLRPGPAAPLSAQILGFGLIGAYGGFLQAGVGFFLLMGASLLAGEDLARGNVSKNLLVATFTVPALAFFVWSDLVAWAPALCLGLGSILGGVAGARLSMVFGPGFIRVVLAGVVLASSTRLLGLW